MFSSHDGERRLYRVVEVPGRLSEGDYAIEGYETLACCDTKRSLEELRKNLFTADKERASKALERLATKCRYPYVMLDMTPAEFNRTNERLLWPDVVQDECFKKLGMLGIRLLWLPAGKTMYARQQTGEYLIRILLGHVSAERTKAYEQPPTNSLTANTATAPRGTPQRTQG